MKQILLKTGILLFCYTLIISNHLENSKYFIIRNTNSNDFRMFSRYIYIPEKVYISEAKYFNFLSTYSSGLKTLVVANSSEKVLPFENSNNLWITLFFLLSVTIIIIPVDINDKFNLNKKVLLLSIPILFYFFQSFNQSKLMPLIVNHPDTESDITMLKNNLDDLESNQSSLEDRVSDLEY